MSGCGVTVCARRKCLLGGSPAYCTGRLLFRAHQRPASAGKDPESFTLLRLNLSRPTSRWSRAKNIKNAHTRRRYCTMLIDFSLLINGSIKWHGLRGRARLHGAHMKERGARMSAHFPLFVQIVSRRGRRMRCLSARLNAVSVSRSFVVSVGVGACLRSARRREAILPWPLAFAWARAVRPVLSAAFTSMPG